MSIGYLENWQLDWNGLGKRCIPFAFAALALLAIVDWFVPRVQLAPLALVPLLLLARFTDKRVSLPTIAICAAGFSYIDSYGINIESTTNGHLNALVMAIAFAGGAMLMYVFTRPAESALQLQSEIAHLRNFEMWQGWIADHDHVTNLPNGRMFRKAWGNAVRGTDDERQAALVVIRVADLTKINLRYGSDTGDRMLYNIGFRLQHLTDPGDHLFRLGGGEFAIVRRDVGALSALRETCSRIARGFGAPFYVDGKLIQVAVRLGLSIAPDDGTKASELLDIAREMLYRASSARGPESAPSNN